MEEKERVEEEESKEEQLWSWGAGTDGQLGTVKLQDEHLPQFLPSLSSLGPISLLSCGGAHVIALTPGGRVLTWGRGTSGQLGHGDMFNCLHPKPVDFFQTLSVIHVSAGWNHSGFVSESGCLFTCGDGSFGQLGHGDYNLQCSPLQVSYFASSHVAQIACGMRHSLVLIGHSGDRIYGFGSGKRGQLGISEGKVGSINLPQITIGLEGAQILNIYANGDHSAALFAGGHLYTWGRGFSSTSDVYYPHCISTSLSFTQAALGWNHALVITNDRKVCMLGGNHHGVLSDPQKTNPAKHSSGSKEDAVEDIPGLNGIVVQQIAAGAEHSALVTESGLIMTWGWGEHGQLGLGNTSDQTSPQAVRLGHRLPDKHTTIKVYCGSGFTYAVKMCCPPS